MTQTHMVVRAEHHRQVQGFKARALFRWACVRIGEAIDGLIDAFAELGPSLVCALTFAGRPDGAGRFHVVHLLTGRAVCDRSLHSPRVIQAIGVEAGARCKRRACALRWPGDDR